MTIYQTRLRKLEERTINFGVETIKILRPYINDRSLEPLIRQVIRSATSIGANYAEANNASSKIDFKNKIFLAKKEVAETRYWLRTIAKLIDEDLSELHQEALEFNLIFQQIISTMKNGK